MSPRIQVISASAGSGKTYRLAELLQEEVLSGAVRPDAIVATTFTRKAAAELQQRVRQRLLEAGRPADAQRLSASRMGTVNSVCGSLVTEFAYELGLSPRVAVLEEGAADSEMEAAIGAVVGHEQQLDLQERCARFGGPEAVNWRGAVSRICKAARANGIDASALTAMGTRSAEGAVALFAPPDDSDLDGALAAALGDAVDELRAGMDERERAGKAPVKKTAGAFARARRAQATLGRGHRLGWGDWQHLARLAPEKALEDAVAPLHAAAARHDAHPALHADVREVITQVYAVATDALAAYEQRKRELGVLDFVDQEALALRLLKRPDVRHELAQQLDLVLVDEFQDTSPIQLAIFLELSALATRSVWVGDQKQAIYGFRGADPSLMDAAIAVILGGEEPETLPKSWRSRPELVRLTSALFSRAFPAQDIPAQRVHLVPALEVEPPGLGPEIERWTLESKNQAADAAALADALGQLLADGAEVRDREADVPRPLVPGDIAVLCRSNKAADGVVSALAAQGIRSVRPRAGLLATPEGRVAEAALRLAVDGRDSLAVAELTRFGAGASAPQVWLGELLSEKYAAALMDTSPVPELRAIADAGRTAGPLALLDGALDAAELDARCAGWGDTERRRANVEQLRAHAVAWVDSCEASGAPCTPAGLLAHLQALAADDTDRQSSRARTDAVTVSTWHAAKGLEWPVVVLADLSKTYTGSALGVAVEPAFALDLADPLAGRWVRWWFSPYGKQTTGLPFYARLAATPEDQAAAERERRQELRVLYVGWTRARDRVVLAARGGKLTAGLLGHLKASGELLLEDSMTAWAGRPVAPLQRTGTPQDPVDTQSEPGTQLLATGPVDHPAATVAPSSLDGAGSVGPLLSLGPRLPLRGDPPMAALGEAVHGFLASATQDEATAARLLAAWGVQGALTPRDVVSAGTNLQTWIDAQWPGAAAHAEWPVQQRLAGGTLLRGFVDLVLDVGDGWVVIDHKTFPGGSTAALARAAEYAGQLAAYANALTAATRRPVVGRFIHFPVSGCAVEVLPA